MTEPSPLQPLPQSGAFGPTIGLALGGGGARGLAHILVLEAFDELGLRPKLIAGTSIGALFGAAYALGMGGREIRARAQYVLGRWTEIARQVLAGSRGSLLDLWKLRPFTAVLVQPAVLLEVIFPELLTPQFSQTAIPLKVVATDFHRHEPYVMDRGALLPAVAASIALPALFRPVEHDGRVLLDGGMTNPVPFDLLAGEADLTVACDVLGGRSREPSGELPSPIEIALAASQIMQNAIVNEMLKVSAPDILLRPNVEGYRILQFHLIDEILANATPVKDELKRGLEARLDAAP